MDQQGSSKVSLRTAMATVPLDSHRYLAHLPHDHCYGQTAHGGLLVSVVIFAVQQHFKTTHLKYNHPHTFNIETVFLRPAAAGEAVVEIKDIKLGAIVSTVQFALVQSSKQRVVGYASNMNLNAESGISYPTHNTLYPEPAPVNMAKLAHDADPNWVGYAIPWHARSFLKPITHFRFFSPIQAPPRKDVTDVWMRFNSPEARFTNEMLGSVADHWHRMPENYCTDSVWNHTDLPANALRAAAEGTQIKGYSTTYAYPTLSMHLEIKKSLPPQGAQWLFLRAQSTEIKNGRFDAEITILDENLDLVALSTQVCFVINSKQIPDDAIKRAGKL